jgi:hypothetical protein
MFGRAKAAMSETERQRWERTRARGQILFCIQRALILGTGAFLYPAYRGVMVQNHPMTDALKSALEPALSACIIGLTEGAWEWNSNEKRYARTRNELGLQDESISNWSQESQRGTLNGNKY